MSASFLVRSARAVVVRPDLWFTALRQLVVLARPGWWWHPPFLPVPDARYLAFRIQTMYGGDGSSRTAFDPDDLLEYLQWCRAWPRVVANRRR